MKDFPVLYFSAKIIFPALIVLLTLVFALVYSKKIILIFDGVLVFLVVCYLVLVSAFTAYINFGQPIYLGVAWQIKVFPLLFFYSVYFLLYARWFSLNDFYKASMILSVAALCIYIMINVAFDPAEYAHSKSYFFVHDSKGYRFRFPDVPVLLGMFIFFWRWKINMKMFDLFVAANFFLYFIFIHQQRLLLICIIFLIGYRVFRQSGIWLKCLVVGVIPVILMVVFSTDSFISLMDGNDGSVNSRLHTVNDIANVLSRSFSGLVFGYGNISTKFNGGFETIYGPYFWLSDVGWLGLLYEYGMVGTMMIAFMLFRLAQYAEKIVIYRDPFLLALRDMVWIIILVSIISPRVIYSSGVTATLFAILVFAYRDLKQFNIPSLFVHEKKLTI